MSMLAERKQKQKWYLNPRANKEWAQDSNKFGQRMLEKMGWSAGKGLGANEDGIKEQIKVKYKNDVQGIGYQLRDDQWTQHENNFTQLLANLGSGEEATKLDKVKPEKSLEKKSQTSRARVHYHKFTRGKDLAQKSEKDLANIFGRKSLEKVVIKQEKEESDNEDKETKKFGIVTIKSGNMTDYFKSKFSKLSDKFSSAVIKKEDGDESESEFGTTVGFGFGSGNKENNNQNFINFVTNSSKTSEKDEESESETTGFGFSSVSNTNKQNFISFVSPSTQKDQTEFQQGVKRKRDEEGENLSEDKKKKKNKKKKSVAFDNKGNDINISEEVCYDNPCLNEEENSEEQNVEENGLDNPAFNDEPDKKNRKSVTFASPLAEYSTISDDSPKKKKKKKKKKHEIGIDNPACEEQSFDETQLEEQSSRKKRKSIDSLDCEESTPSKKSKKKKRKLENGIDNLGCEEITPETTPSEEPKKSKKKKKTAENNVEDSISEEISTPKKSKKKRKSVENGITNLACEEYPVNCADNLGCSVNLVEEGIESITNAIDNYQTELENEMNEQKNKRLQKDRKLKNKSNENVNDL